MSAILEPGDIISFSAQARSITGVDRVCLVAEQHGESNVLESIDPATSVYTLIAHGLANDEVIQFALAKDEDGLPVGQLPDGLQRLTDYYVINATADTFQVAAILGGAAVDIVDAGTGNINVFRMLQRDFGTPVLSDTYALSLIEEVTVHALFQKFAFFGENLDDTEDGEIGRLMCVRGASAVAYTEPVFLWNVNDATMIRLSGGTTVEAEIEELKVNEISANRIVAGTIGAEVINVGGINLNLDGINSRINVQDNQAIPATRVRLGKLGAGDNDYGLELFDASGVKVIGFGGALYDDGTRMGDMQPAEVGAEATTGQGTSVMVDDAGLGESANWSGIVDVPDTLAAHGITDGQTELGPSTSAGQVLQRDFNGDAYWADKYADEINAGAWRLGDVPIGFTPGFSSDIGSRLLIPNPGRNVAVVAMAFGSCQSTNGEATAAMSAAISLDGGANFINGTRTFSEVTGGLSAMSPAGVFAEGVPTGDIILKASVQHFNGSGEFTTVPEAMHIAFWVFPRSEFFAVAGPLTVTIPGTAFGACSGTYPTTTCHAAATVTASASGGTPGYSYAASKVSGTDSITSGATSRTCTVAGTHTTDSPAGTTDTTIKYTVTDDASAVASSGNCVVTLSYLRTYSNVHVIVPNKAFGVTVPASAPSDAEGEMTRSPSGGDGDYDDAWVKTGGDGSIISGATTSTPLVRHSAIATNPGTTYFGNFKDTITDGRGDSDSDSATVSFTHTSNS